MQSWRTLWRPGTDVDASTGTDSTPTAGGPFDPRLGPVNTSVGPNVVCVEWLESGPLVEGNEGNRWCTGGALDETHTMFIGTYRQDCQ